jgi:hypothetical protein
MKTTLHRIGAADCEVCKELSKDDAAIAESFGYDFLPHELEEFAETKGGLRDYVINYHVDEDGYVEVPVYVITTEEPYRRVQASTVAKTIEDARAVCTAWEQYQAQFKSTAG